MAVFENGQPEELLGFLKNFRKAIDGTGTTAVARRINYLRTILCGEALWEFDGLTSQNNGTTNAYLKEIQQGLPA